VVFPLLYLQAEEGSESSEGGYISSQEPSPRRQYVSSPSPQDKQQQQQLTRRPSLLGALTGGLAAGGFLDAS
jgi:hypothetical protein